MLIDNFHEDYAFYAYMNYQTMLVLLQCNAYASRYLVLNMIRQIRHRPTERPPTILLTWQF